MRERRSGGVAAWKNKAVFILNWALEFCAHLAKRMVLVAFLVVKTSACVSACVIYVTHPVLAASNDMFPHSCAYVAMSGGMCVLGCIGFLGVTIRLASLTRLYFYSVAPGIVVILFIIVPLVLSHCTCNTADLWPVTGRRGYSHQQCELVLSFGDGEGDSASARQDARAKAIVMCSWKIYSLLIALGTVALMSCLERAVLLVYLRNRCCDHTASPEQFQVDLSSSDGEGCGDDDFSVVSSPVVRACAARFEWPGAHVQRDRFQCATALVNGLQPPSAAREIELGAFRHSGRKAQASEALEVDVDVLAHKPVTSQLQTTSPPTSIRQEDNAPADLENLALAAAVTTGPRCVHAGVSNGTRA